MAQKIKFWRENYVPAIFKKFIYSFIFFFFFFLLFPFELMINHEVMMNWSNRASIINHFLEILDG